MESKTPCPECDGTQEKTACPECLGPRHRSASRWWCMPDCPRWGADIDDERTHADNSGHGVSR